MALPPLAASAATRGSTYERGRPHLRRRASAPRSPWAAPLAAARAAARALRARRAARVARASSRRAGSSSSTSRPRGRRPPRGADGVPPADRAADDPRQRAGGGLPGGPQACRRSTACTSGPNPQRSSAWSTQLAALDVPTPPLPEAHDPAAGGRRGGRDQPHRGRARAPHRPRRAVVHLARAALAQAGLLLAREPRPRRAGQRRATATSPRRSAATRTWSCTARCSSARASTTRATRRRAGRGRRVGRSAAERDAMEIERDADDVCLCLPARARAGRAGPRAPEFEGEVVGPDRRGRVRRLRRGGLRGLAAGAAHARRLVGAERAGDDAARRRRPGGALRLGDPVDGAVERDRCAARPGRPVPGGWISARGQEGKAQGRARRRRHQPAGGLPLQPAREVGGRHRCSRAPRSSRCATARCS